MRFLFSESLGTGDTRKGHAFAGQHDYHNLGGMLDDV